MTSGIRILPFDRPTPFSPPAAYEELRRGAPIARVLTAHGESAWMVTRWEVVKQVLSDPRWGVTPPDADPAGTGSLFCDGQDHARLRRLVSRTFTARTLDGLRPRVHELGDAFVTDLVTAGPGADLVAILARPLPLTVICEILGIRVDDRDRFHCWADAALGLTADIGQAEGYGQAWGELAEFLGGLIATKREAPGGDLLSVLVAIRDADDGRLSDTELLTTAVALLTAGYLTTANALSTGLIKLLEVGGLADLSENQEAIVRAVEEMLRLQTGRTAEAMPRWAQVGFELYGQPVAAGDMVLARLEAANHDPAQFADPDRFDPDRAQNQHVAFGYGPHHCLGAALARLELTAAVTALARRVPALALACPPEDIPWTGHPLDDGPAALPVTW